MTIFVSLAAYRELELRTTIESAILNAKYPNQIYFGVFSQADDNEFIDVSDMINVTQERVLASEAQGAGYARNKVMKMYSGQDYFLQIDSHSIFVKDWDIKIVEWYSRIQKETNNKKIIISSWALPYRYDDSGEIIINSTITHDWHWKDAISPHYNVIVPYGGVWTAERIPMEEDFHESLCVLGGFIFADGSIVKEVPYDPRISWHGEEIIYSVRAYCKGWRIYSIKESLIYHHYDRDIKRIWDDKKEDWSKMNSLSIKTSLGILAMKEKGKYAIADEKQYVEYQHKAGIKIKKRALELWKKK